MRVVCEMDGVVITNHASFMYHLHNGIKEGYPLCCVIKFAAGKSFAMRDGMVRLSDNKIWVPCDLHKKHPKYMTWAQSVARFKETVGVEG